MASRFESVDLLETHKIDMNELLFKDEFNIEEINNATKLNAILYDHNCTIYPILKTKVIEIIDHHKDLTNDFYDIKQQITKNISTIGSATSLLGEYFMNGDEDILDPVIADCILKIGIIDSYNFDPKLETERWNQRDIKVFQFMQKYLNKTCPQKIIDRN